MFNKPPVIMNKVNSFFIFSLVLMIAFGNIAVLSQPTETRGAGPEVKVESNGASLLYAESHALIIGASDYTNGWKALPGVKDDLAAVKQALVKQKFKVTEIINPSRKELKNGIDEFITNFGLQRDNRVLIYFAGHGFTDTEDRIVNGYIVPVNAPHPAKDKIGFLREAVSMSEIENYARQIRSKHALFIFDSCFSGTLLEGRRSSGIPEIISIKTTQPVRQFITSGAADQEVPDRSIFLDYFIKGIQGAANNNSDNYVTVTELSEFLQEKVSNATNKAQTPLYGKLLDARYDKGDFVFSYSSSDGKPPEIDLVKFEDRAFQRIKNSNEPNDFRDFLEKFPNGANAEKAKVLWETSLWAKIQNSNNYKHFEEFIRLFPKSKLREIAEYTIIILKTKPIEDDDIEGLESLKNSIGMPFVLIRAGEFTMGSTNGNSDENPVHTVKITKNFYLGQYEVTQKEWKEIMGTEPSYFNNCGENCPVENVSYAEVQIFLIRLGERDKRYYRLPTEAEWEYACRAGSNNDFSFGNNITDANANINAKVGKNVGGYLGKTTPVGTFQPNEWGLYDMHGNVWEWVYDFYSPYNNNELIDPMGPEKGLERIVRGGSWYHGTNYARSANRTINSRSVRQGIIGFRVLLEPAKK